MNIPEYIQKYGKTPPVQLRETLPHFCLLNQTETPSYDIVTNFHTGVLLNLCKNHCPNTLDTLPEQMKRSFYQKAERVSPAPVTATDLVSDSYEQSFPGYEDDFLYFTGSLAYGANPFFCLTIVP